MDELCHLNRDGGGASEPLENTVYDGGALLHGQVQWVKNESFDAIRDKYHYIVKQKPNPVVVINRYGMRPSKKDTIPQRQVQGLGQNSGWTRW